MKDRLFNKDYNVMIIAETEKTKPLCLGETIPLVGYWNGNRENSAIVFNFDSKDLKERVQASGEEYIIFSPKHEVEFYLLRVSDWSVSEIFEDIEYLKDLSDVDNYSVLTTAEGKEVTFRLV